MSTPGQARIGIDIGGTSAAGLILGPTGDVEAELELPTVSGVQGILDTVERVVSGLAEQTGRALSDFGSLGVGIPGQIDHELGLVRHAYNIGIDSFELGPALHERFGIPVSVDNDVTAAAIGAAHLMQLEGTTVYLNIGTGLAAGCVINGQVLRGAHGVTGEIGHLAIAPLNRPCPCGQRGCLETVASGSALKTFWRPDATGRLLAEQVAGGDPLAATALDNLTNGAATAIRLLTLTLDPHTLVIGGGLRLLGEPLVTAIKAKIDRWADESAFLANLNMSDRLQVLPAGSPAAAAGAALSYTS